MRLHDRHSAGKVLPGLANGASEPILVPPNWLDQNGHTKNSVRDASGMPRSKAEEITDTLREEILRGQYRAGERLPSERDLASRFEANRSSVREAIKKLEQLGIADVQPGGVRVVAIEDATLEVLGYLMDNGETPRPKLIEQLLDVLGAMVALSASTAIKVASDEQLQQMSAAIEQLRNTIDQPLQYQQHWRELSLQFTNINQNLVLRLIFNGLKTQFVGRLEGLGLDVKIDQQRDLACLDALANAIDKRDTMAAGTAIAGHFLLLKDSILQALATRQNLPTRSVTHA